MSANDKEGIGKGFAKEQAKRVQASQLKRTIFQEAATSRLQKRNRSNESGLATRLWRLPLAVKRGKACVCLCCNGGDAQPPRSQTELIRKSIRLPPSSSPSLVSGNRNQERENWHECQECLSLTLVRSVLAFAPAGASTAAIDARPPSPGESNCHSCIEPSFALSSSTRVAIIKPIINLCESRNREESPSRHDERGMN